jgi:hypothetical protein
MVFLLHLCPHEAVTHVLRMQSLREQSLTQSLVALALQTQGTKICILNVSEVEKSVGGEEKVALCQFAVVNTSLKIDPVMVIQEPHNVPSMFVIDLIGDFGHVVCSFRPGSSRGSYRSIFASDTRSSRHNFCNSGAGQLPRECAHAFLYS